MQYFKIRVYNAQQLRRVYRILNKAGYKIPADPDVRKKLLVCYESGKVEATTDYLNWQALAVTQISEDRLKKIPLSELSLSAISVDPKNNFVKNGKIVDVDLNGVKFKAMLKGFAGSKVILEINTLDVNISIK